MNYLNERINYWCNNVTCSQKKKNLHH